MLLKWFKIKLKPVKHETIDGLRGYIAFFVFLHHACIYFYLFPSYEWILPTQNLYIHFGQTSVSLFFMITGFLFFNKLIDARINSEKMSWTKYFTARVLRIYPLFIFCLIIMLVLVGIKTNFVLSVDLSTLLSQIKDWFLFGIFNKPPINGYNEVEGLTCGVLWSMKFEWIFYLAIPILAVVLSKQRPSILVVLICSMGIYVLYTEKYTELILFNTFIYGFIAALIVRYEKAKAVLSNSFFSFVCFGLIFILVYYFNDTHSLLPQLITGVIFIIIANGNKLFGVLTSKLSKAFGQLAYSIYLMHGLVLFIVLRLIIGDMNVCTLSLSAYWTVIALTGIGVVIVSFITHYLIELPAIKRTKKIESKIDQFIDSLITWLSRNKNTGVK